MFSYASGHDLCKLDVMSRQFQEATATAWGRVTHSRFGMRNGKEGWKQGTAYLRDTVFIHFDTSPDRPKMYLGPAAITSHNSLIAVITNDDHDDEEDEAAPSGINLYDANDLNHKGIKDQSGRRVTIAGPPKAEIFVTNHRHTIEIIHRDGDYDFTETQEFPNSRTPNGMQSIGSQSHVIVVAGNMLHLNMIPPEAHEDLIMCQTVLLGRSYGNDDECFDNSIAWGREDQSTFCSIPRCEGHT